MADYSGMIASIINARVGSIIKDCAMASNSF